MCLYCIVLTAVWYRRAFPVPVPLCVCVVLQYLVKKLVARVDGAQELTRRFLVMRKHKLRKKRKEKRMKQAQARAQAPGGETSGTRTAEAKDAAGGSNVDETPPRHGSRRHASPPARDGNARHSSHGQAGVRMRRYHPASTESVAGSGGDS